MNLFNTDIITSANDALWADVSAVVKGQSPKPVLIVTNRFEAGTPEEAQLKKMLEACGLTGEQYNVVHLADGQKAAWYQLREQLAPKAVFLIGVHPAQLGIAALFVLNQANNFDSRVWLPTVSLSELGRNDALKVQLWNNGMKPIFKEKKFGQF
jgi:hypothetical protein